MKAGGAVLSWLHAARRRAQPGLQRVRPSWPARRFNACAMRGRVRVRAITPSSPFLFGYNKISFSIHILQVKFVDKLWPKVRWGLVNQNGDSSFFNQRRVSPLPIFITENQHLNLNIVFALELPGSTSRNINPYNHTPRRYVVLWIPFSLHTNRSKNYIVLITRHWKSEL